jgi:hypothetical protein
LWRPGIDDSAPAAARWRAKELPPDVRSSLATGLYTPDSRICLEEHASLAFKQRWEQMARHSFQTLQSFLGLPGTPVEFIESYSVADTPDRRPNRELDGNRTRRQHDRLAVHGMSGFD